MKGIVAVLTVKQEAAWKDDLTVFTMAHEVAPHNAPVSFWSGRTCRLPLTWIRLAAAPGKLSSADAAGSGLAQIPHLPL